MPVFALATLAPMALIAAAALWGGVWALAAPLAMTLVVAVLDHLVRRSLPPGTESEFPAADALSALLALGQVGLLLLAVPTLAGDGLTPGEKAGLFIALGLFLGQIGNANAHELIHRGSRRLHGLGVAAYVSVLYGHHASAHVLIHHVRVATRDDPATARRGESLWRYIPRAWRGGFVLGWQAESARLARTGRAAWCHPYATYLGGAALALALAAALGGPAGLVWFLALAAFAQLQLLMSDYVQHYGLLRRTGPDGRHEPVGDRHSWNSPHPASSAMMLNAPRHSDHHGHPGRPYPALRLPGPDQAPHLPRSLPVMACVALWPQLWRRVMHPRLARWETR